MATKKQVKQKHKVKKHIDTVDFYGNPVHCTSDQWHGHIIDPLDGHPEMVGREADVKRAIENPEFIKPSTTTGLALAYEGVTSADTIRVIVYYENPAIIHAGATAGKVVTAYPDDPSYPSNVGKPIYTKPTKGGA
jgi:hypothetical protein